MSTEPTAITNKAIRPLTSVRLDQLHDCNKLAKTPLHEAGMAWLESRRPFIAPSTVRDYTIYLATITKFFGNPRLEKIANPDLIRAYQLERAKMCGAKHRQQRVLCYPATSKKDSEVE